MRVGVENGGEGVWKGVIEGGMEEDWRGVCVLDKGCVLGRG